MQTQKFPTWAFWGILAVVALIVFYCFNQSAEDAARQAERGVQMAIEDEKGGLVAIEENVEAQELDSQYFVLLDAALQTGHAGYQGKYGLEAAVAYIKSQQDVPLPDRIRMEKALTERMAASRVISAQGRKKIALNRCQDIAMTVLGSYFDVQCPPESEVLVMPSLASRLPQEPLMIWGSSDISDQRIE